MEVLETELSTYESEKSNQIYLQHGLNEVLTQFLNSNVIGNANKDLEFHDFRGHISVQEQHEIFNEEEIENLKKQISTAKEELIYLIDLPPNINYYCAAKSKVEENYRIGVPLDNGINKLILSSAVVTSTKGFVLLAVSYGYQNAMSGGIRIYKKQGGEYRYYTTLDTFLE